jgi:hypothetical protein
MPETIEHLLMGCSYIRLVWYQVLNPFGWHHLAPSEPSPFDEWWTVVHKQVVKERRNAFNSIVVLVMWSIWLHRNDTVFGRRVLTEGQLIARILTNVEEWCRAGLVVRSRVFG